MNNSQQQQQQQQQQQRQHQQMPQQAGANKPQQPGPQHPPRPQGGGLDQNNSQNDNYIDVCLNLFEAHKLECCVFIIALIVIIWMYFSDFNINDLFKKKE